MQCPLDFHLPPYRLPRVRQSVLSHIFSRSVFSVLFPFCLQYFLSYTLCFGCVCFQCLPCYYFCSCSTDFSLMGESNSLSDYRITASFRILSSLSGCNSLVAKFPSDGSHEWYIRWLRFVSNLIERGIAVSCFSVLAVRSVSCFRMRGFQFFRFICLFCSTLFSLHAS